MQEVVVVGGGIAGGAVALKLAERGVAVNVVDAGKAGGAATGASAGMLAPQYESAGPTPLFDLLVRARDAWPAFADRVERLSGHPLHLRWNGMLVANLSREEHEGAAESARWQTAAGQAAELIDPTRARDRQPGLGDDPLSYLWLPGEGQVDSQALSEALPGALDAAGVRLITGVRVAEVSGRGGRVDGVRLEDGRLLSGDTVVVAAGAWSGEIDGLPRPLPVRPVRGHMIRFPAGSTTLGRLVAGHAGRYLVPRDDGSILAGSTMDEVGFDRSLSEEGLATVRRSAARLVPALARAEPTERWADLRPLTPDTLPVLGADPQLEGLHYATGYGRNGILLGPLTGRLLADLVTEGSTDVDLGPYAPDRFGEK